MLAAACRGPSRPSAPAPASGPVPRLLSRALGPAPVEADLASLCDGIGGRPTGSRACDRAVDWALGRLRDGGVDARTEEWTLPRAWLPTREEGSCLAPARFPLRVAALPRSPATPPGGIEAPVAVLSEGERPGAASAGRILLVATRASADGPPKPDGDALRTLVEESRAAGAAALLVQGARPDDVVYRLAPGEGTDPLPLPAAVVGREGAGRLLRLARNGEVRVSLRVDVDAPGPLAARNVVAEWPGRALQGESVLLVAHLDSWDLGTGALDDGVGAVAILDAMRALRELDLRPRRSVRALLTTGEEQGRLGSAAWVERHRAELPSIALAVVADLGAGTVLGFRVNGRKELGRELLPLLAPLPWIRAPYYLASRDGDGDDRSLADAGVPAVLLWQDLTPLGPRWHAGTDVLERVDPLDARRLAATVAAVAWQAADRPARLGAFRPAPTGTPERALR